MFLTREGRKIDLCLESVSDDSGNLDIWKYLDAVVSINRNLYMRGNSELGKLKYTLGEISDLDFCRNVFRF